MWGFGAERQPCCMSGHHGILIKQAEPQVASVMKLCNDSKDVAFGPYLVTFSLCYPCRGMQSALSHPHPRCATPPFPCQWAVLRRARLNLPLWEFSLTFRCSKENCLQAATQTLSLSLRCLDEV